MIAYKSSAKHLLLKRRHIWRTKLISTTKLIIDLLDNFDATPDRGDCRNRKNPKRSSMKSAKESKSADRRQSLSEHFQGLLVRKIFSCCSPLNSHPYFETEKINRLFTLPSIPPRKPSSPWLVEGASSWSW
jgi:hypothetical protein